MVDEVVVGEGHEPGLDFKVGVVTQRVYVGAC